MPDKHLSTRFDSPFNALSSRVMELAGLVEAQTRQAIHALAEFDGFAAGAVVETEARVNQMEIGIDRELSDIMNRRQPKASELRLLTAMGKTVSNLERVGDEADCIARKVQAIASRGSDSRGLPCDELQVAGELAAAQLRRALDAFVRLDTGSAVSVLHGDRVLDREFGSFLRKVALRMAEEPRVIPTGVDLVLVAKAIERIGDHAKNIAECIIYVVNGADVRHCSAEAAELATR